jgi:FixJ family two-component response regulator
MQPLSIILVDDNIEFLGALKDQITEILNSVEIEACSSGEEALEVISSISRSGGVVALIISDYKMGGITGVEFLVRAHELVPKAKKILLSGHMDIQALKFVLNQGAIYRYMTKPWEFADMNLTVKEALISFEQDQEIERRQKELEVLNANLESEVEARTLELYTKNKELEDGMTYASYVQRALFPNKQSVSAQLAIKESVLIPLQRVSGDFFWLSDTEGSGRVYLAIGDCTGHGIAGAFMSVMHVAILNEAITECEDKTPLGILTYLRNRIASLTSNSLQIGQDHFLSETTLLSINEASGVIEFATCNNRIILLNKKTGQISEPAIKNDGRINKDGQRILFDGKINLEDPFLLYIFTDGVTDQFMGTGKGKLKRSGLKQWISDVYAGNASSFESFFESIRSGVEQTDDATMVILESRGTNATSDGFNDAKIAQKPFLHT